MNKRRLTQRQTRRIHQMHKTRQQAALSTMQTDEILDPLGPPQEGLLIAQYGQQAEVETHENELISCYLRQNIELPVPGDKVIWHASNQQLGIITTILPRSTVLVRPDRSGQLKPLAANINQMIIVFAPLPLPTSLLIDRYLIAAELLNLKPILVFNKIDLLSDAALSNAQDLFFVYQQIGYSIIKTSIASGEGLNTLQAILTHQQSVFVGQSGVGKSSLMSHFLPETYLRVGNLSSKNSLGKHTTSTARLYHLPQGGHIIDSPGVRYFNLWNVSTDQLLNGFKEFRPWIGLCQFRDCRHQNEPNCALLDAVVQGKISRQRLLNFILINQEYL